MKLRFIAILLTLFVIACNQKTKIEEEENQAINPSAPGFNMKASDSTAIALADSVMVAMGGRAAWDNLRYISWNFFGVRGLVWDKYTGRVRIDYPKDSAIYLINVNDNTGKVMKSDKLINQPDSLAKYISRGKSIWINDSYWLVMPFKLKDSGVTLKYVGEDTTQNGIEAHVLKLTFDQVGDTPNNMYKIYIDKNDYLVKQWNYYQSFEQDTASAKWPMDNYKAYKGVLISADRSDNRGPKNVHVYDSLSDTVFESFEKPAL